MSERSWRLVVVALAILASVVANPVTAGAQSCPSGRVCVWDYNGLSGNWYYWSNSDYSYYNNYWFGTSLSVENDINSAKNWGTTGKGVVFYDGPSYSGQPWCLPWHQVTDFNSSGINFDNMASSHLWTSSCGWSNSGPWW